MSESAFTSASPAGAFATTLWTVVLAAGGTETTQARHALERLCRTYWYPLYAHARRQGHSAHDAQDLVQGFLAHLIERQPFAELSPARGRFRSFLLAALNHHLADDRDRRHAAKRGGGQLPVSLDDTQAEDRFHREPATTRSPEEEFDRRWALAVLERALEALAAEHLTPEQQRQFACLQPFLTEATGRCDYSAVAAELALRPNTVAVMVSRLRQRYRDFVRAEIAATLADPGEVAAEMEHLLAALRG